MTLTRQEIFDTAYRGLAAQGFNRSINAFGGCMYRAPSGRKCAVGFLIPDDRYEDVIEGKGACWVAEGLRNLFLPSDDDFLVKLQECHDNGSVPSDMQEMLHSFASRYELKIPDLT